MTRKIGVIVGEKIGMLQFSNIDLIAMTEVDVEPGLDKQELQQRLTEEIEWIEEVVLGTERQKILDAFEGSHKLTK